MITIQPAIYYHIDLWGYSFGWIKTIQNKFLEVAPTGSETCTCEAQMSCYGYFENQDEVDKVNRAIKPLLNLAAKTKEDCDYAPRMKWLD